MKPTSATISAADGRIRRTRLALMRDITLALQNALSDAAGQALVRHRLARKYAKAAKMTRAPNDRIDVPIQAGATI